MRTLQPAPHDKPYALLEPLVEALLARGAVSQRPGEDGGPFAPSPEGFVAVLHQPIDWPWITANYELPAAVRYDEQRDVLLDDEHWTAVYGSSGTRALQLPAPGSRVIPCRLSRAGSGSGSGPTWPSTSSMRGRLPKAECRH